MLPNEVLLNANSVLLIHILFEIGILPDSWSKSIIKTIPKNKTSDPRLPLNYQGISLIPTMCKLFSMLLNNRLSKTLESQESICDEQNDFRKARSFICTNNYYKAKKSVQLTNVRIHA